MELTAKLIKEKVITSTVHPAVLNNGIPYTGKTEITPHFYDQTLHTKSKTLDSNIHINAIEVSRTMNYSGGKTVYIGVEETQNA